MVGAINTRPVQPRILLQPNHKGLTPLTPEQDQQLSRLLQTYMRLNHKQNRIVDENGYPQTLSNFAVEAHCSDVPFSLPITIGNEVDFCLWQTWVSVWNDAVRFRRAQGNADHKVNIEAEAPQVSVTGDTMTMANLARLFGKRS
jgi:hypothetical protein